MNLQVLAVSLVVAIATTIAVSWVTRPADPAADRLGQKLNSGIAILFILAGGGAAITFGTWLGSVVILGAYLLVRVLKLSYERHAGGITGFGLILSLALTTAMSVTILTQVAGAVVK